jgi:hypothetical protein
MRVHGRIAFSTEDCTGSKGCSDFLFSAPLVIPDIQKLSGVLKSTYVSQILTPLAKSDVAMLAAALQLKRWILFIKT